MRKHERNTNEHFDDRFHDYSLEVVISNVITKTELYTI